MPTFNNDTFINLMHTSKERAFAYRDKCKEELLSKKQSEVTKDIPEAINIKSTNEDKKVTPSQEINPNDFTEDEEESEQEEFTREDLIVKLKDNGITVHPNSKDETLLKKCLENKLI